MLCTIIKINSLVLMLENFLNEIQTNILYIHLVTKYGISHNTLSDKFLFAFNYTLTI